MALAFLFRLFTAGSEINLRRYIYLYLFTNAKTFKISFYLTKFEKKMGFFFYPEVPGCRFLEFGPILFFVPIDRSCKMLSISPPKTFLLHSNKKYITFKL